MNMIEVETDLKETLVAKKEIGFYEIEGQFAVVLSLTLAQGVDPATVEARLAVEMRRHGAKAVSLLPDEPRAKLEQSPLEHYKYDAEGRARIRVCFFMRAEAFDKESFLKEHLVDGQILVEVDLEVAVRREQLGKARDRLETFVEQVAGLKDHHDYKLVCGEEEFPCHQVILAAWSPVVARGLAQGEHMGRSVKEAWQVMDSHPAAVNKLLDFIYTAMVPEMEEEGLAVEVLALADFFEVMELKDAAKEEMIRQLSASNALGTLVEVDRHMQEDQGATKAVVIEYIRVHVKKVMASDDWKANAKGQPGLMEEILAALAEHMDQPSE